MRFLLDTHLIVWAARGSVRLPDEARRLISDPSNTLLASVASIWEIAIKFALNRADFRTEPRRLRRALLENGYEEVPVNASHVLAAAELPSFHKDPFDRLLVAQANVEGVQLLTVDKALRVYGDGVWVL